MSMLGISYLKKKIIVLFEKKYCLIKKKYYICKKINRYESIFIKTGVPNQIRLPSGNRIFSKLNIQIVMENKLKFNEWMKQMKNIYFYDNEQMTNAYIKIN
jgi:hypothetical protein